MESIVAYKCTFANDINIISVTKVKGLTSSFLFVDGAVFLAASQTSGKRVCRCRFRGGITSGAVLATMTYESAVCVLPYHTGSVTAV